MKCSRRLSKKSIVNYSGAVGGYLSELAQRLGITSDSLFNIKNYGEFKKKKIVLESCAEFIEKDCRGKKMYSNALQRYLEFLNADAQCKR